MRLFWIRLAGMALAAAVGCQGAAQAAEWSVAQMSGAVVITVTGAQPVALTAGATLPAGGTLTTGPAGRALLVRNKETIVVGPNSAIAIPEGSRDAKYTTILQKAGVVEYLAEKKNVRHFAVETPYLAAAVKGTEFIVTVTRLGGSVEVQKGSVEVQALANGQVTLLEPGQAVHVGLFGGLSLSGAAPLPAVLPGTPREAVVELSTVAGLGLFRQMGDVGDLGLDEFGLALAGPGGLGDPLALLGNPCGDNCGVGLGNGGGNGTGNEGSGTGPGNGNGGDIDDLVDDVLSLIGGGNH
jgi:hypothetical protein